MAHAHVNAFIPQLLRSRTEIGLAVMVGEENARLKYTGGTL